MPLDEEALDGERLFVAHWGRRTHVRPAATPEEDPVVAIAATRVIAPLHLSGGWPTGRRQPSAAVRRWQAGVVLSAIAVCGTLLGAGSLAGAGQATAPSHPPAAAAAQPGPAAPVHVVQPGDTLWALGRRLQPEGDVRPLVARLRAASGGGPLVPGQRLRLAV